MFSEVQGIDKPVPTFGDNKVSKTFTRVVDVRATRLLLSANENLLISNLFGDLLLTVLWVTAICL